MQASTSTLGQAPHLGDKLQAPHVLGVHVSLPQDGVDLSQIARAHSLPGLQVLPILPHNLKQCIALAYAAIAHDQEAEFGVVDVQLLVGHENVRLLLCVCGGGGAGVGWLQLNATCKNNSAQHLDAPRICTRQIIQKIKVCYLMLLTYVNMFFEVCIPTNMMC
eukprot:1161171-Pelagomonas_calceolata.AAC.14